VAHRPEIALEVLLPQGHFHPRGLLRGPVFLCLYNRHRLLSPGGGIRWRRHDCPPICPDQYKEPTLKCSLIAGSCCPSPATIAGGLYWLSPWFLWPHSRFPFAGPWRRCHAWKWLLSSFCLLKILSTPIASFALPAHNNDRWSWSWSPNPPLAAGLRSAPLFSLTHHKRCGNWK